MTAPVGLQDPAPLRQYAKSSRGAARKLLDTTKPHAPIDPGPDGIFEPVRAADERAHQAWALWGTDAFHGLGGLAYVADFIAVTFPAIDQDSGQQIRRLGERAMDSPPDPPAGQQRVDPRFVSPALPR